MKAVHPWPAWPSRGQLHRPSARPPADFASPLYRPPHPVDRGQPLERAAPDPQQAAFGTVSRACHHGCVGKDRRPASRAERFWAGANARGIPLQAIVAAVAVVAATYLAGKLLYRLRDVVLLLLIAGFSAVLLNPVVAGLQRRGIRPPRYSSFVMTVLVMLVFAGLAAAFGRVLNGMSPVHAGKFDWRRRVRHPANPGRPVPISVGTVGSACRRHAWGSGANLPAVGGALAGIPAVLFAVAHSLTAGIVTAVVFVVYTQIENHVLNPVVMS